MLSAAHQHMTIHAPLAFRIGAVTVILRSDHAESARHMAELYAPYRTTELPQDDAIRMEVRTNTRMLGAMRRYAIYGDDQLLAAARRASEIVPYLEWGINWRVVGRQSTFMQIHAASLACGGGAVVIAGQSGAGKSTLAASLLRRGWKYYSDEFALVERTTLHVHAFPKALCVKQGAFDLLRRQGIELWQQRFYVKAMKGRVGYVCPHECLDDPVAAPQPVRWVFVVNHFPGAAPRVVPQTRGRAAFVLAGLMMNRVALGDSAVGTLTKLVGGADCFQLTSGDIRRTCDLIESVVVAG